MFLYVGVMLAFFLGITARSTNEGQRYACAFVSLCLLFLVFVVISVGHGVSRFRLPFMLPISMFAVLGFARTRSLIDDLEMSTWTGRVRGGILGLLVVALLLLCVVKLPLLLAP